jgi:Mn-dependent DtxR family transcriptional regulator
MEIRAFSKSHAAYRIMKRYFEVAGFGNERTLSRILQIDPALVDAAMRRLEREGVIAREVRIEGMPGAHSVLREFM